MLRRTVLTSCVAFVSMAFLLVCGSFAAIAQQHGGPAAGGPGNCLQYSISRPCCGSECLRGGQRHAVLYETSLAMGKRSAAIEGKFTSEAALRMLLIGTGARWAPDRCERNYDLPESRQKIGSVPVVVPDARFLGALQTGILNALCRNVETRPGAYRLALQLWILPTGVLQRASLLGTTGDARRDTALIDQLRGVSILSAADARDEPAGDSRDCTRGRRCNARNADNP